MPVPGFMKTVKVGRVAHITIDHPPLNTSNTEILQELARDVLKYEADGSVCVILLDSANQKSPFAADGAALLANPGWQAQFEMLREGQRAHRDRILVKASRHGNLRRGLHGRRLGASADLSYFERLAAANYLRFPRRPLAQCRDGTTCKGSFHYFGRAKALALTGYHTTADEAHVLRAVNHVVDGSGVLAKAVLLRGSLG